MSAEPIHPELQKLRDLSSKIQDLMREADVGGLINLQGREFAEHAVVVSPSWSVMSLEPDANGNTAIRFRCKLASGTPEEKERGRYTIGMLDGMIEVMRVQSASLTELRKLISTKVSAASKFTIIGRK